MDKTKGGEIKGGRWGWLGLGGVVGGKGGTVFRNTYKGHIDNTKGGEIRGGRWGWLGLGGVVRGKCRQL